eukprot:gene9942-10962_t
MAEQARYTNRALLSYLQLQKAWSKGEVKIDYFQAMLTEKEKKYSADLLETLEDFDLQSLFRTVTQKQIAVESRKEAIDAITLCSGSVSELLKRTKLKKEHLRDYLLKFKDRTDVPTVIKADKMTLVRITMELWKNFIDSENEHDIVCQSIENVNSVLPSDPEAQQISESFVPWFYNIFNSSINSSSGNMRPEHFWNDAKLLLHIEMQGEKSEDEVFGSKEVSEKLTSAIVGLNIYFHPNVNSEGIKGFLNRYGLLIAQSAGTLHRNGSVVGLFEQVFGLIRDPHSQGNWKIKNTELRIRLTLETNQIQSKDMQFAIGSC